MAVKIICDRCGKEINRGDGVYHVRLYAGNNDGLNFTKEVSFNISESFKNVETAYCYECIDKISKFVEGKVIDNG